MIKHRANILSAANQDSDISDPYNFNMGAGDSEDDDPDPSDSRIVIFRVCVLANKIPYQDTSASYTYLGNQAGNTKLVEDILVWMSGAGSLVTWMSTCSPCGLQTHFLVCIPAALGSSQDSSASSIYLGNQAGNIFTVEDLLTGAEWWRNKAWLEVYIEHGLRVVSHAVAVFVFFPALRGLTALIQLRGLHRDQALHMRGQVPLWSGGHPRRWLGMGDNSMGNRQVQWVALGGKGAVGTEQTKGSREGSCRLSQESTRSLGTRHEAKLSISTF